MSLAQSLPKDELIRLSVCWLIYMKKAFREGKILQEFGQKIIVIALNGRGRSIEILF